MFFLLDENNNVIPAKDCMEWAKMFEHTDRHVKDDVIGNLRVSTVFMGLNLDCLDRHPPLVFETMVFKNDKVVDMWRYHTYDQALKHHTKIVHEINNNIYKVSKNDS